MSTFTRVTANTIYQLLSKIINAISGLIIISLITRSFGEQAVGAYTLILTYISLYFIVVDYGANAYAVKAMHQKQHQIYNKLLGQRLIIAIIVSIIASLIVLLLPNTGYTTEVKTGVLIGSSVILAQAILATSNALFQFQEKYQNQLIINTVSATTNVVLIYWMMQSETSINILIISYLISSFIGAATALYRSHLYLGSIRPMLDHTFNKQLFKETAPITISMITNLLYFRIDALIMPFFRPLSEVGHYNVAYRIFDNALAIPSFLGNALYPTLLRVRHQPNYRAIMSKIVLLSLAVSTIIATALYLAAPYLILLISNQSQPDTVAYLRILVSGLPLFFLTSIIMWQLITSRKQHSLVWIYGINMFLSITLNVALIPSYGAYAAAYLTIILEAVVLLCSSIALKYSKQHE